MTPRDDPRDDARLFDGGPPLGLLRLWGRFGHHRPRFWRRALVIVCLGWLPLLAFAALALANGQDGVWRAFLRDASVHARSLVAAPLLVLAEAICIPRLGALASTFCERGIVPAAVVPAYRVAVNRIQRLRDSWFVEAFAVLAAYLAALLIVRYVPASFLPDWHRGDANAPLARSLASWWHAMVSLPLLLVLVVGWVWRLFLWARYLWLVSRLPLRLLAPHPDGAAGLMFVGYSLRAFTLPAAAAGAVVAATALAHIWAGGAGGPEMLARLALVTIIIVLVACVAPLLAFSGQLLHNWQRGTVDYGALVQRVGVALEDKWMRRPQDPSATDPLSTGDFSAATDLFQTADKAFSQRLTAIDLRSLLALTGATALPFGLVALALVPFDQVLQQLVGLFL
ncbi:hypothetical protein WKW79_16915 [Variovorax robiniae]|uniref:ABC transporter permease n=1 Tax=Variovorax robiniae TaxID=1836199 RepID=A0ABU8XAZ9_9BURK